jgi:hypothetical protein
MGVADRTKDRKRVLLIAASILAARKLAQSYDGGVPATVAAIAVAVPWAEEIMTEIDRRLPMKPAQQPK